MSASDGMLAPDEAPAARQERATLAAAGDETVLALVLPDALPVELHLSDSEKAVLRTMLCDLVAALQTNRADGADQLAHLLRRLGTPEASPASIDRTGIPADVDKVMDFDQFFRVTRIASQRPAQSLVLGLARTAHAVVGLFDRLDDLSEARARQQIDGFIAYAHLLARTFGLGKLS